MAKLQVVDGVKRIVEKLLGRRKLKKSYEYEVQFLNTPVDQNTWMPRDRLEEMGFSKMVNDLDIKEAAAQGLHQKPLTAVNVQKHLENIGLEAEFGTHSQMKGLSGGQKVKVGLGGVSREEWGAGEEVRAAGHMALSSGVKSGTQGMKPW